MIYETPEDVLEHFGVQGMKWGVRKAGRGARATARIAGRGVVGTGRAIKKHPIAAGAIAATGLAFATKLLMSNGSSSVSSVSDTVFSASGRNFLLQYGTAVNPETLTEIFKNL